MHFNCVTPHVSEDHRFTMAVVNFQSSIIGNELVKAQTRCQIVDMSHAENKYGTKLQAQT